MTFTSNPKLVDHVTIGDLCTNRTYLLLNPNSVFLHSWNHKLGSLDLFILTLDKQSNSYDDSLPDDKKVSSSNRVFIARQSILKSHNICLIFAPSNCLFGTLGDSKFEFKQPVWVACMHLFVFVRVRVYVGLFGRPRRSDRDGEVRMKKKHSAHSSTEYEFEHVHIE